MTAEEIKEQMHSKKQKGEATSSEGQEQSDGPKDKVEEVPASK
jgi:hypothetical protein